MSMNIQIICKDGKVVTFPEMFIPYSEFIQRILNEDDRGSGSEDEGGSGGEDDEEKEITVEVKATQESVKLMLALLEMEYEKDHNNILPPETPTKVTAPKFKIEKTIGADVVEFFTEHGKDAVFAITQVADFLQIKLITHLCFTWIAHSLNTRSTEEKMKWLGLTGDAPTFEEIMEVNLKTGEIPSMDKTNEGGVPELPPAHIESKEGGAAK